MDSSITDDRWWMLNHAVASRHDSSVPSSSSSSSSEHEELIQISPSLLLLSTTPLLGIALLSYQMGLGLESPIVVGILRTLTQLSILGAILHPIFAWGVRLWWVVLLYVLFMITLAAWEATRKSSYYFTCMFQCVLAVILVNVGAVSLFAFGVILRPSPLWDPQYVIPIVGMLLGNVISGISLSLNTVLTSLHEQGSEIEVYLAFGANPVEATSRIVREAVRCGAIPQLNSMAVIGIISIPGMMTGQILGGSSPMTAAVYQMFIIILISIATFGTILAEVCIVRFLAFEGDMFQSDRFRLRPPRQNFLQAVAWLGSRLGKERDGASKQVSERSPLGPFSADAGSTSVALRGRLEVTKLRNGPGILDPESPEAFSYYPLLEVKHLSKTVGVVSPLSISTPSIKRTLFRDLSFTVNPGDIFAVRGPSGIGKSQLLRVIAKLAQQSQEEETTPLEEEPECGGGGGRGRILLAGGAVAGSGSMLSHHHQPQYSHTQWRRQIRYVSQSKLDLTGTPRQFIEKVSSFASWEQQHVWGRISVIGNSLRASVRKRLLSDSKIISAGEFSTVSNNHKRVGSRSSFTSSTGLLHLSPPTCDEMTAECLRLVQQWGLNGTCLDTEWKLLSGGESQRVHVAIAVASQPLVLLLDESTAALDLDSKLRVEHSVLEIAAATGMAVVWITHDDDQVQRLGRGLNNGNQ